MGNKLSPVVSGKTIKKRSTQPKKKLTKNDDGNEIYCPVSNYPQNYEHESDFRSRKRPQKKDDQKSHHEENDQENDHEQKGPYQELVRMSEAYFIRAIVLNLFGSNYLD